MLINRNKGGNYMLKDNNDLYEELLLQKREKLIIKKSLMFSLNSDEFSVVEKVLIKNILKLGLFSIDCDAK